MREIIDQLSSLDSFGYQPNGPASSEPTALAALALTAYEEVEAAERALRWLVETQKADGSVGVTRAPVSYTHLTLPTICSV